MKCPGFTEPRCDGDGLFPYTQEDGRVVHLCRLHYYQRICADKTAEWDKAFAEQQARQEEEAKA